MKFIFLLYTIFFLLSDSLYSQDVYFIHGDDMWDGGKTSFSKFNNENCFFEPVCSLKNNDSLSEYFIEGFTFLPDNNIIGTEGFIKLFYISIDSCKRTFESYGNQFPFNVYPAILSNEDGDILVCQWDVVKYITKQKKWIHYGVLADTLLANNETLMYRDSNYYYATSYIDWYANYMDFQYIVKLDTSNTLNSKIIFTYKTDESFIDAMFSIRNDCESYNTYVIYKDSTYSKKQYLGELDFNSGLITKICEVPSDYLYIYDAKTKWNILNSDCELLVDLDLDNSSGAERKYDYIDTARCFYDDILLSDVDLEVYSGSRIDSMHIFFVSPVPDGTEEFIDIPDYGGLAIVRQTGQKATLINKTPYDFNPLEITIRNTRYRNTSIHPAAGERKIGFVAYSKQRISDTAYAHIIIEEDYPVAGEDTLIELCADDPEINLMDLLSEEASLTGKWIKSTTESGIFDPQKDEEGMYPYVVSKKGCEPDTAFISIIVHPLPQIDLGQDITVTFYDTIVHLIAGTNIDQYSQIEWYINGELQDVQDEDIDIVIDDSKEIRVVIYDENGCEAMDTLLITIDFKVNIYVPNIFTPDGDGINDIWHLDFKDYKPDMLEGAIYNRWGEKIIFWNDNDNIEWDGTFKGKRVSPGVYVYYIKYRTSQGKDSVLTGDITVIR